MLQWQLASFVHEAWGLANLGSLNSDAVNATSAETRDRTGDLQIFSLTLSQLSYRGHIISVTTDMLIIGGVWRVLQHQASVIVILAGLEPAIFGSEDQRLIH